MSFMTLLSANIPNVLSAAVTKAAGGLRLPDHWPGQLDLLTWCEKMSPGLAAALILFGVIYLLFGLQWFKGLVILNAVAVGIAAGAILGDKVGAVLPGIIIGAVLAGAVTWPFMNWAVALQGAVFGAVLGAALWQTAGLDQRFIWSGALSGLILCGLLCFILFRASVMAHTSLQGSVMLIFGLLGLLFKYDQLSSNMLRYMSAKPFVLPLTLFIATIVGMIFQQANGGAAPAKK